MTEATHQGCLGVSHLKMVTRIGARIENSHPWPFSAASNTINADDVVIYRTDCEWEAACQIVLGLR